MGYLKKKGQQSGNSEGADLLVGRELEDFYSQRKVG